MILMCNHLKAKINQIKQLEAKMAQKHRYQGKSPKFLTSFGSR